MTDRAAPALRPADLARLLGLAAIWGLSFPLQHVAAEWMAAEVIAWTRIASAALLLLPLALRAGAPLDLVHRGRDFAVLGLINTALPFTLFPLALGRFHTPAALASILNATSPLFAAAVTAVWLRERVRRAQALGLALGVAGVVVLSGWRPGSLPPMALAGIGLCLLAGACYGWSSVFTRRRLAGASPLAMAACSQTAAALWLAPLAARADWPRGAPPIIWAIALFIGLACTGLAYILYFRLIVDLGPARALTVTFLIPVFGILWSRLLLGEPIHASVLGGAALVLAGTALVTGALPRRRVPVTDAALRAPGSLEP